MGNRESHILQSISPDHWNHVRSSVNPADCASRGLFPSELSEHQLCLNGPEWLRLLTDQWSAQASLPPAEMPTEEEKGVCLHVTVDNNFHHSLTSNVLLPGYVVLLITVANSRLIALRELATSENYWISLIQHETFAIEIKSLTESQPLTKSSRLFSLHPFIDQSSVLRVGGRGQNA